MSNQSIDVHAAERKKDHIKLALTSKVPAHNIDTRFEYEPLLAAHPINSENLTIQFLNKKFNTPIWVSSMTGGTSMAAIINQNLAKACGEFGLGMGLGSCRQLLYSDEYVADFQLRKWIGDQPLYANLGIAQVEHLIKNKEVSKIRHLLSKLDANGLIVHVNPLQEWLQPEGDRFEVAPIITVQRLLDENIGSIIVKEVGQGMGPASVEALLKLPIDALDFAACGGTNFALLEILRSASSISDDYSRLAQVGHSAASMVMMINTITDTLAQNELLCRQVIISGGISDFLDGYYLMEKIKLPAVYGQASGFLKHAQNSYEVLQEHISKQINGLSLAKAYLKVV
ncbi:MAG: isopentenyl-diphosphate delta-isomerase [Saprospiraceae bacterium]